MDKVEATEVSKSNVVTLEKDGSVKGLSEEELEQLKAIKLHQQEAKEALYRVLGKDPQVIVIVGLDANGASFVDTNCESRADIVYFLDAARTGIHLS